MNMANKNENIDIHVKFYEGYKGEETPRSVFFGSQEYKILAILDRKRIRDLKSKEILHVYKCRIDGHVIQITHSATGVKEVSFLPE